MSESNKEADWRDIEGWIDDPRSVLDIGCGSGHIHKYLVPALNIQHVYLMDGTKKRRSKMGWNPDGTVPWRDVEDAVRKVSELGVGVSSHRPDPHLKLPTDLIISLKSWGFHYPVRTYMKLVKRSLKPGGRIILDIRKTTDGIAKMAEEFHLVELDVGRSQKCFRSVWEHKK